MVVARPPAAEESQVSTHIQSAAHTDPGSDWRRTIDEGVAVLSRHKDQWARLPVAAKVAHLRLLAKNSAAQADRWVRVACRAKGLDGTSAVVDVFPQSAWNRLLLSGVSAQVWMQPGVTEGNLADTMAVFHRQAAPQGAVTVVLGAGNIASIAPLDVLYKLFAEGHVCLLKMNPVNDYLGPIFEGVFGDLVAAGFVRFAYGGSEVGERLTQHEGIDEIHITGSSRTHDAIVFGGGDEGVARKARGEPINTKRMSSELGNVSPTIVVPGPWDAARSQLPGWPHSHPEAPQRRLQLHRVAGAHPP
jgi:hypothetical protein